MEFIHHYFFLLLILLLVLFIATFIMMKRIAKSFFTMEPDCQPFSIFNLEFPGSEAALTSLMLKMDMPVKKKVRQHLKIDFLFMLAVYPGIAMLCYKLALNIRLDSFIGHYILTLVAISQGLAWLFDVLENTMLLRKIKSPFVGSDGLYRLYKWMVGLKYFIVLTGINSFFFVTAYVWVIGNFSKGITQVIAIIAFMIIIFIIIKTLLARRKRIKMDRQFQVSSSV